MNCLVCKVYTIGPNIRPGGGFMCSGGHMQCVNCNQIFLGRCSVCLKGSCFVRMDFVGSPTSSLSPQSGLSPLPSAPPLSNSSSFEEQANNEHETQMFDLEEPEAVSKLRRKKEELQTLDKVLENTQLMEAAEKKEQIEVQLKSEVVPSQLLEEQYMQNGIYEFFLQQQKLKYERELQLQDESRRDQWQELHSQAKEEKVYDEEQDQRELRKRKLKYEKLLNLERQQKIHDAHEEQIQKKWEEAQNEQQQQQHRINQNKQNHRQDEGRQAVFFQRAMSPEKHMEQMSELDLCLGSSSLSPMSNKCCSNEDGQASRHTPRLTERTVRGPFVRFLDSPRSMHLTSGLRHLEPENRSVSTDINLDDFDTSDAVQGEYPENNLSEHPENISEAQQWCDEDASTSSSPKLETSEDNVNLLANKHYSDCYFVMSSIGNASSRHASLIKENHKMKDTVDMRIRRVYEALQEDQSEPRSTEKPQQGRHRVFDLKLKNKKHQPSISSVRSMNSTQTNESLTKTNLNSLNVCQPATTFVRKSKMEAIARLSNVMRACVRRSKPTSNESLCSKHTEPQFQLIFNKNLLTDELIITKSHYQSLPPLIYQQMKIPSYFVKCPDSRCDELLFLSNMVEHYLEYHQFTTLKRGLPGEYQHVFIDLRLAAENEEQCQVVYLVSNKVEQINIGANKSVLPIALMSTILKPFNKTEHEDKAFLVFWLAGIVPQEYPMPVTLAVWARTGKTIHCHRVQTINIHSLCHGLHSPKKFHTAIDYGNAMILSPTEVKMLMKNKRNMIEMQMMMQ